MPVGSLGPIGNWNSTYLTKFLNDWLRRNPLPAQDQLTIKKLAVSGELTAPFHPAITSSAIQAGPPVGPSNGDIWIALNAGSNGEAWQFRFNATSSSPYKWEFIGGPPVFSKVDTSESTTNSWPTVTDLTTVGPDYTPARAGDYLYIVKARCLNSGAGLGNVMVVRYYNGSAWVEDADTTTAQAPAGYHQSIVAEGEFNSVPAGGTIRVVYCGLTTGGTATFMQRRLFVWPVRVS